MFAFHELMVISADKSIRRVRFPFSNLNLQCELKGVNKEKFYVRLNLWKKFKNQNKVEERKGKNIVREVES